MIRLLAQCITDENSISRLQAILKKLERCAEAGSRGMNLADILSDSANLKSLHDVFGDEYLEGMQLLLKCALRSHTSISLTTRSEITGERKIGFILGTLGTWKQFDVVLQLQVPSPDGPRIAILNPANLRQRKLLKTIPVGSLITVHLRGKTAKRSRSEEALAAERCRAVFETVQNRAAREDWDEPVKRATVPAPTPSKAAPAKPRKPARPSPSTSYDPWAASAQSSTTSEPVASFQVVISKMDTFVHAGNAHLILSHLRDYQGKVQLSVLRAEKKKIQLDADTIWGAEIRNGETVLFEFFGPKPTDVFLKELAKRVNKYTQMDKVAGE